MHIVAAGTTLLWVAINIALWSLQQAPATLLWEALVMAAIGFPAFFWYVKQCGR